MTATITYRLVYKQSEMSRMERAYHIVKIVTPELGEATEQDVALFNFDSEGRLFGAHVFACGLDGSLIDIDRSLRESMELERRSR